MIELTQVDARNLELVAVMLIYSVMKKGDMLIRRICLDGDCDGSRRTR